MPNDLFIAAATSTGPAAEWATQAAQSLKGLHVEAVLLPLLWQVGLIILVARVCASLFRRMGQPGTVGEIAAGLLIGPSVLGKLAPDLFQSIFHPVLEGVPLAVSDQLFRWILTSFSQFGLILLLFLIGMEFDFKHLKVSGKSAMAVSVIGVVFPFVLGFFVAEILHSQVGQGIDKLGFQLFLGTAMSITAIPVLGRIMMELGITRSKIGALTISAAAVNDAIGWILLATVAGMVKSRVSGGGGIDRGQASWMLFETVLFGVGMVLVVRPLLRKWVARAMRNEQQELSLNQMAILLVILFACAIVTNLIGIFAIFGAFVLGAILSEEHEFREAVNRKFMDFVTAFFLPIFFAYTGARTDIGTLGSPLLWGLCGLVLLAAIVGKFGGCGLAAWLTGSRPREAACIGVMMNTRGLMELVVINVGKDLGVIPDSVYCMLVLMALLTTVMTTPILLRTMRGTELEPLIEASGFLKT
jgi:Kef-type K+ transport system membrane component KefB